MHKKRYKILYRARFISLLISCYILRMMRTKKLKKLFFKSGQDDKIQN